MREIRKHILKDEGNRPVAVQIAYDDWLEIERRLGAPAKNGAADLNRFAGVLKLKQDPVEFQRELRGEWE